MDSKEAYLTLFAEWLALRPERAAGNYAVSLAMEPELERLWFQALRDYTIVEMDAAIMDRLGVRVPRTEATDG